MIDKVKNYQCVDALVILFQYSCIHNCFLQEMLCIERIYILVAQMKEMQRF
jgi:hypothetical protein